MAENFPVFPIVIPKPDGTHSAVGGIMLRDYFATQAMNAYVHGCMNSEAVTGNHHNWTPEFTASEAYKMADAMLKARGSTT